MDSRSFRPDFLVIGAQKSGTTTLHEWLASEGTIGLPWPKKETHFFCYTDRFEQGLEWYRGCFPRGEYSLRGEVDPSLMCSFAAPHRIANAAGDIPVVALLRDPLARAYSHWAMNVFKGREKASFADALSREVSRIDAVDHDARVDQLASTFDEARDSDSSPMGTYVWRGLYEHQLQRWLPLFSSVSLYTFDDLFLNESTRADTYARLLAGIGYTEAPTRWDPDRRDNRTESPRFHSLSRALHDPRHMAGVKRAVKAVLPSPRARLAVQRAAVNLNSTGAGTPPMPPVSDLPTVAIEMLQEDAQRLVARTGIDVSGWRVLA
jgi:hypothetical protein